MAELARDSAAMSVVALLAHYSFDSGGLTVEQLVDQWLRLHSVRWVRLALIEALYQGRYKAISVTQILAFWRRRDRPLYRFDPEFEQLICNRLPKRLSTEGQRQSNLPASVTDVKTRPQAKVPQANSKNQPKTRSASPLLQVTPESLAETSDPAAKEGEQIQSPEASQSYNPAMKNSNKVLSSPVRMKTDQPNSAPSNTAQSTWSELGKYSIHRFTPNIEASSFHTKLSALAQRLR